MALYKLEELVAYQLSMDLKQQVFCLLYNSPAAKDLKLAERLAKVLGGLYFSLRWQAEVKRRAARPGQRPPRVARRRRRRDEG